MTAITRYLAAELARDECPRCADAGFFPAVTADGENVSAPCRYCVVTEPCPICDTHGYIPGPWGRVDCPGCEGVGLVSPWRRDQIGDPL